MICPDCTEPTVKTKCIDSRRDHTERRVIRVRECPVCGIRMKTMERALYSYERRGGKNVRKDVEE